MKDQNGYVCFKCKMKNKSSSKQKLRSSMPTIQHANFFIQVANIITKLVVCVLYIYRTVTYYRMYFEGKGSFSHYLGLFMLKR